MKKISIFLAALMFFTAVTVMPGNMQEVQAYTWEELSTSEMNLYRSGKAGTSFGINLSFSELITGVTTEESVENANALDFTGAKVAYCPPEAHSLDSAVAVWDISNEDKYVSAGVSEATGSTWFSAYIRKDITFGADIPEGMYDVVIFDALGQEMISQSSDLTYTHKMIMNCSFGVMNDDGYVYAYVYAQNLPAGLTVDENLYPTLYGLDKTTPLTSFDGFTTCQNADGFYAGETVYVYRLKVESTPIESGDSCNYYYSYNNNMNGQLIMSRMDTNGIGVAFVSNVNEYTASPVSPFDTQNSTGGTNTSAGNTTAPAAPQIATAALTTSDVPEVQASIDEFNRLMSAISTNQSNVLATLRTYAPGLTFSSVAAGGTLDVSVQNGVDISGGADITFSDENIAANVTAADTIIVLHIKHDGTIECVPAVAGNGSITATFTSLSPVAWFKVSNAQLSPKTGENFFSFLFH